MPNQARNGALSAIGAYLLWGLLPIYWKALDAAPAVEILAHRIAWSFACFLLYFALKNQWTWLRPVFKNPRQLFHFALTSLLITANWGIYIWAVNSEHVVESSLGYFINPLVSVMLGVVFLSERLRPLQWVCAAVAASGVAYLTINYGSFPWIAISLALTFGLYGLLKKRSTLNAMQGMLVETGGVILPAVAFLLWRQTTGDALLGNAGWEINLLLILSGFLTGLPLLLFASAAKRIPLATLGLLQYLAPTLQFLIGVLIFHEPFGRERLIGFSIIWFALALFSIERLAHRSRSPAPPPAA